MEETGGIEVYVEHYRFPKGRKACEQAHDESSIYSCSNKYMGIHGIGYRYRRGGPDRSRWRPCERGGYTVATLRVDGREYTGLAQCSPLDAYSYDIGRAIAEGRARKKAGLLDKDGPLWANQPVLSRLEAERFEGFLTFADTATGDRVTVTTANREPHLSLVDIKRRKRETMAVIPHDRVLRGEEDARRDVWSVVTADHCEALRVGLTVHCSFFSSQPHPFEVESTDSDGWEEVFAFYGEEGAKILLEGEGAWRNGRRCDEAWPVRPGQLASVPMGWHRVTALPREDGTAPLVWYWWCYLALPGRGWEKDR